MEEKYLTVVEEHVDRLGEMAKNIQEVRYCRGLLVAKMLEAAFLFLEFSRTTFFVCLGCIYFFVTFVTVRKALA